MRREFSKKSVLRILAATIITLILLVFVATLVFVTIHMKKGEQHVAVDGKLKLAKESLYEEPIHLNGEWETFEGVVCFSDEEVQNLKESQQETRFPIASIVQAKKDATYRLKFSLPKGETKGIVLYVPTFYRSADIYLNGKKLDYVQDGTAWLPFSTLESTAVLTNILPHKEWQELVITGSFKNSQITLYKRPIIIGTMKNISVTALFETSNEMFLFGLLMLILVNGYIFMLLRPEHRIISMMTLFDSAILIRAVLSMNHVISFGKGIFPDVIVSDRMISSATLFFILLAGVAGCKLSSAIFDPENKAPQWLVKPMPWIYGIYAFVFPHMPYFFESYGKYILIVTYGITFIGVFLQYKISLQYKERRTYNALQMIKTIYIGILIFFDISLWDISTNYLLLFYLYSIFFLLHIVVRLYDNNESYRNVELLNANLENTVKQRTKELSEANQVLSELSIKDPLTKIFNRLYFDGAIERAIINASQSKEIYLAMFDLDFFKRINDTYGHDVGDEELIFVVNLVSELIDGEAVFARIGGEEFVLLFRESSKEEVLICLEKVRVAIAADAARNEKRTTASFGVSSYQIGDTSGALIKRADVALYKAKGQGRNCIITNF